MVDGKFCMRDHEILTVNEAAIMKEAYQASELLWDRILENGELPLSQPKYRTELIFIHRRSDQ